MQPQNHWELKKLIDSDSRQTHVPQLPSESECRRKSVERPCCTTQIGHCQLKTVEFDDQTDKLEQLTRSTVRCFGGFFLPCYTPPWWGVLSAVSILITVRFLLPHIFRVRVAITTNNSAENVTTSHTTCPKCQQTISVEIGRVATCPVCHAAQLHGDPESNEKWRTCPNCSLLFQAAPVDVVSCPHCQTNQIDSSF